MQPLEQLSLTIQDAETVDDIITILRGKYSLAEAPLLSKTTTFYDTFDWRLYADNRLCSLRNQSLHLTDFSNRDGVPPLAIKRLRHRFWWQFPPSEMKDTLADVIDIRALLPLVTLQQSNREVQILNKDEKVVCVVTLIELDPGNGEVIHSVQLSEVRGYRKWFSRVLRDLSAYGSPQPHTALHLFTTVLDVYGRAPLDYTPRFSVALKPDMAAITAATTLYQDLLDTMQVNLPGIINDLDSEFLHDFRVAIRRTRSGLSLIKNVVDPTINARFKDNFRYLGQLTGPVRDLDVYLLMEDNYKARLPEHLQEGLHYFFEDLSKKRRTEHKKLVRALASPKFQAIIDDWQTFLEDENNLSGGAKSHAPIGPLANTIINKRCKRVFANGRKITTDSPDEELHELRIQGKKLRYSLEFFSSLYPRQEIKILIKNLKRLQNNLGDFNDLSVQQDMLRQYLADIKPGTIKSKKLSAAIGGLLTNLFHEQQRIRTQFELTFQQFAAEDNINLYKKLFQQPFFLPGTDKQAKK